MTSCLIWHLASYGTSPHMAPRLIWQVRSTGYSPDESAYFRLLSSTLSVLARPTRRALPAPCSALPAPCASPLGALPTLCTVCVAQVFATLVLVQPTLLSYELGGQGTPVPLEPSALSLDRTLILDTSTPGPHTARYHPHRAPPLGAHC